MKKKLFFVSLFAFALVACDNKPKGTDAEAETEDSVEVVTDSEVSVDDEEIQEPTADEKKMMDFVESLIFENETSWSDYDWVKEHTSVQCQEYLKEYYPFDNEDGEGMATWRLTGRTEADSEESEREIMGMWVVERYGKRIIKVRLSVSDSRGEVSRDAYYDCSIENGTIIINNLSLVDL